MIQRIAIANQSGGLINPADLVWAARAVGVQLETEFCPAWRFRKIPIMCYGERLPPQSPGTLTIFVVKSDGNPKSAGYHAILGQVAFGFVDAADVLKGTTDAASRIDSLARILGHEAFEALADPGVDRWAEQGDHSWFLVEPADPVETLSYRREVSLMGSARAIAVTDFVTPEWFGLPGTNARFDQMGKVGPGEIAAGGYQIARDDGGHLSFLPLGKDGPIGAKLARAMSRVSRARVALLK